MNFSDIDDALRAVAEVALQNAEYILNQGHNTFDPFILLQTDGVNSLKRFISHDSETGLEEAMSFLEDLDSYPDLAIIAYPKDISLRDEIYSSVYIQIYGSDEEIGYSFAEAFQKQDNQLLFSDIIYMGKIRNILIF